MAVETDVAILMSTYNGEKFIKEQIDSIINQTYDNWKLYIRDDGSTDNTLNIIKNYVESNSNIFVLSKDKNVGVIDSFFILLRNVNANFYMCCDQDDVWLSTKIEDTVKGLNCYFSNPILVYTKKIIVDENLNKMGEEKQIMTSRMKEPSFSMLILDNIISGCSMGFNKKLRDIVIRSINLNHDGIIMHDWWIAILASYFGEIYFVDKDEMLYRQHNGNVVGANIKVNILYKIFTKMLKLLKHDNSFRANLKKSFDQANEFYEYSQQTDYSPTICGISLREVLDFLMVDYKKKNGMHNIFKAKKLRIRMTTAYSTLRLYILLLTKSNI